MRIIKPYGRSHIEPETTGRRRILRLNSAPHTARNIMEFAHSHDALIIAQWISIIDKIATKPAQGKGATDEQRKLRKALGDAAWRYLTDNGLLLGLTDESVKKKLALVWTSKIEPYGDAQYRPRRDKAGKEILPPSPKGRWYKRFVGDIAPQFVDATKVAEKIYEHLHQAEYRINETRPNKRQGLIAARAESISGNVLRRSKLTQNDESGWSKDDQENYAHAGNVAETILEAAKVRNDGKDGAHTRRVSRDLAAKQLFQHYARVFKNEDATSLSIKDARARHLGLFNLHMAVKDCYTRLLKNHRKNNIVPLLPKGMNELFALVDKMRTNRDLSALVRLGKVIHYQTFETTLRTKSGYVNNWPKDVSGSWFWTSDGQAEIKRNEAFVRVWRHIFALAAQTLRDWASPDGKIQGDILGKSKIDQAVGNNFSSENYLRKLDLLFGNRAKLFNGQGDEAFQKAVLHLALAKTSALRNASFHFTGRTGFHSSLLNLTTMNDDAAAFISVRKLWNEDQTEQNEQLRKTLRAAHCEYFFDERQNRALFDAVSNKEQGSLPLPRLKRILVRSENAWAVKGKPSLLPKPANRIELEQPARLCQYTTLKHLYERPFRLWLENCQMETVNDYINRAVDRTTEAARKLNARDKSEDERTLIIARAEHLPRLSEGDNIHDFFFALSAATATEMRVQRGYEADSEKAREQAEYIEDLKCDVVALAFADYLKESAFGFVSALSSDAPRPDTANCNLDDMSCPKVIETAENWQTVLYFLLHLVPVDEVGKLLHQVRKWEVLTIKAGNPKGSKQAVKHEAEDTSKRLQHALSLYLDMHDAKFEGGTALVGAENFKILFECEADFERVFPSQLAQEPDFRVPRRGLREIMRYGHLPVLQSLFVHRKVTKNDVDQWENAERQIDGVSAIARDQKHREELHEKWSKRPNEFPENDTKDYMRALSAVARHRERAAHVTLTNHVRLHRLMMVVLSRLVDYSGLWERDLYFVSLALAEQHGLRLADIFSDEGLDKLVTGQIVAALRSLKPNCQIFWDDLGRIFDNGFEVKSPLCKIRNNFSHFNMLQAGQAQALNLTKCVNDARRLMAYDRKLKNAVSQSIIELLGREGLKLTWDMDASVQPHALGNAKLMSAQATHLGKIRVIVPGGQKPQSITEHLHGDAYVEMVANVFGATASQQRNDVTAWNMNLIQLARQKGKTHGRPQKNHATASKKR